ncbi:MAG TPA: rhodanese-like domain-containing protein [Polyangia bacterium]|nr:rhodanese-like domain-containing protein [Polyangia bacterium]
MKRIPPQEAAALLGEGWIYLDVRSIPEFEQGHPAGALNVPLLHFQGGRMSPNPDFQRVVEANFPKDTKIVVGCKAGGRSLQAATLMEAAGYTSVVDMRGGYHGERDPYGRANTPGWEAEGLPTETTSPPEKTYETLSKK